MRGKMKLALGVYFWQASAMTWQDFVKRWRMVKITRLGVPNSTVAEWRAGKKEPKGWQRDAAEFWISAKAGPVEETAKPDDGKPVKP